MSKLLSSFRSLKICLFGLVHVVATGVATFFSVSLVEFLLQLL